jgi:hypothetical protein
MPDSGVIVGPPTVHVAGALVLLVLGAVAGYLLRDRRMWLRTCVAACLSLLVSYLLFASLHRPEVTVTSSDHYSEGGMPVESIPLDGSGR